MNKVDLLKLITNIIMRVDVLFCFILPYINMYEI